MNAKHSGPPRIHTSRLLLREFVESDLPAIKSLLSCPRVMEFSSTGPLSDTGCRERLDDFIRAYSKDGFGKWAVVLRASGEVIGYCGPELTAIDGPPVPELGFRLRTESWGFGYATEAASGALDHCFNKLGFMDMLAFIEPANVRSRSVLTKLGFRYQRRAHWLGHVVEIFKTSDAKTR